MALECGLGFGVQGLGFGLFHGQLEVDPVISGVSIVITHAKGLITPIKTTHESLNPKP